MKFAGKVHGLSIQKDLKDGERVRKKEKNKIREIKKGRRSPLQGF